MDKKNLGWVLRNENMTFQDLQREALEMILDGFMQGKAIRRIVNDVCTLASAWGAHQIQKDDDAQV